MILDSKLIQLCDKLIQQSNSFHNPDTFVFSFLRNDVMMSNLNLSHTGLLNIIVDKKELEDYPPYNYITMLPVKRNFIDGSYEDFRLDFVNYRELNLNDKTDKNLLQTTSLNGNHDLMNDNGYIMFPFRSFRKKLKKDINIGFGYRDYNSIISTNLLNTLFVGDIDIISLKLCYSDAPLFLTYKSKIDDLNILVYGAVAPRIGVTPDKLFRVI